MRRITRFDHFFLCAVSTMTLAGCGANNNNSPKTTFSTSAQMVAVQNITAEERAIATRICYAYQSKNINFQTQIYYGGTFNFSIKSTDCTDKKTTYQIPGVLTTLTTTAPITNSLIYGTNSALPFFKNVQTNQSGFLSQLCTKIQTNIAVSNTADYNGSKVQVKFFRSDLDAYFIQYFSPKDGVMKIDMAETFKVRTQFDLGANQILGMDETYSKQQVCTTDATKFSDFNQTFVNFIPPI